MEMSKGKKVEQDFYKAMPLYPGFPVGYRELQDRIRKDEEKAARAKGLKGANAVSSSQIGQKAQVEWDQMTDDKKEELGEAEYQKWLVREATERKGVVDGRSEKVIEPKGQKWLKQKQEESKALDEEKKRERQGHHQQKDSSSSISNEVVGGSTTTAGGSS